MRVIGVVPARMAASRFPGKPLSQIHGKTMLEHVYLRGCLYDNWDQFVIATCDTEIKEFGLIISTPETIWDVSKDEIPLWVQKLGGQAVIKIP